MSAWWDVSATTAYFTVASMTAWWVLPRIRRSVQDTADAAARDPYAIIALHGSAIDVAALLLACAVGVMWPLPAAWWALVWLSRFMQAGRR